MENRVIQHGLMNYKCVYALTSNGRDSYSAMTEMSVVSLLRTNPDRQVVLACDDSTYTQLRAVNRSLLSYFNEVVFEDVPVGDALLRNRWIKTKLRTLIDGPFLYLDADTLVRAPLELSLSDHTDFAAALNHSVSDLERQIWSEDATFLEQLGWKTRPDNYVNGGVLFFNETEGAYRLSECWHKLWLEGGGRTGRYRDQPSLNVALERSETRLEILPDRLNAQFKANPKVATNATIWHYYGNHPDSLATNYEFEVESLAEGCGPNKERIYSLIAEPFPWRSSTPIDHEAAKDFAISADSEAWSHAWLARQPLAVKYTGAITEILKKLDRHIYIWGTGSFGRRINKQIQSIGVGAQGFLTSYPEKEPREIEGTRVIDGNSANQLRSITRNEIFILVATQFQSDVLSILNKMNYVSHIDYVLLTPSEWE